MIPKMNPSIKTLWLSALRSGDYIQGTSFLQHQGDYCCLGVLSDIAVKHDVTSWVTENNVTYGLYEPSLSNIEIGVPTEPVLQWAGLSMANPSLLVKMSELSRNTDFPDKFESIRISDLNDLHNFTFLQIADLIEEQL